MSANAIRAGEAYLEVTTRDKTQEGLDVAEQRLRDFERRQRQIEAQRKARLIAAVKGIKTLGFGFTIVGATATAAGASIFAALARSVQVFADITAKAKELGISLAGLDVAKADALRAAMERIRGVFGAIQFRVGEALAIPLTKLLNVLADAGQRVAAFIKENQHLVVVAAAVAAGLVVFGTAALAIGASLFFVGGALSGLAAIVGFLGGPLTIAVVGMAALAVATLAAAGAFLYLNQWAADALSGIIAALAGGNLLQAWKITTQAMLTGWNIAWFGIQHTFFQVINRIAIAFNGLIQGFARDLQRVESALGINLGAGALSAAGNLAVGGLTAGTAAHDQSAAGAMVAAMTELAAMNERAREDFKKRFGLNAGFSLGGLASPAAAEDRTRFGVAGSTSSATAGLNRVLGDTTKEQKKTNEKLDSILRELQQQGTAQLEFS